MQPEYNTSHNPHYEGIDTSNQDELWMQYIYMSNPQQIQQTLAQRGYTMRSDNDALDAMKEEMTGNEEFVKYLIKLDPMYEDYAYTYNESNSNSSTTTSFASMLKGDTVQVNAANSQSPDSNSKCANDDLLCLIRETLTVRLNIAQMVLIGIGFLALYLIFKKDKEV